MTAHSHEHALAPIAGTEQPDRAPPPFGAAELDTRRPARAWIGAVSVPALVVLPALVAAVVRTVRPAQTAVAAGLGVGLGLGLFRWQLARLFTEQPAYEVEQRFGRIQIRRYAPAIVVETTVTHRTFAESLDEGFRRLFAYLEHERVAMTTPVLATCDADGITVALAMPRADASLPVPRDPRLTLRDLPARRVAARRYVGSYDGDRAWREQRLLVHELEHRGIATRGYPALAAYDPPTTLVPLRRVEAVVEIE